MSTPFIGEIRIFAGNFAPAYWMFCEGQLLPISGNDALFSLIGTTYGGDGQTTFALPDLRGRLPLHLGLDLLGAAAGAEQVTLTASQLPAHSHPLLSSSNPASDGNPANRVVAETGTAGAFLYLEDTPTVDMSANAIGVVGGSQPHDNFQPYLCVNFIISLSGVYPPRN